MMTTRARGKKIRSPAAATTRRPPQTRVVCAMAAAVADGGVVVQVPGLGAARGAVEDGGATAVFRGLPFAHADRFSDAVQVHSWGPTGQPIDATGEQLAAWQAQQGKAPTRVEWEPGAIRAEVGRGRSEAEARAMVASQQPPLPPSQTEDCLTLTVRAPVGASGLPVMVWIHGGNHQSGRAEEPRPTGAPPHSNALPAKGVVLVKIQYRLNLFGYFAHPELPRTNFGTTDTVVALEWIRDHIASFGGDPGCVTIFGVSAGGDAVAHLCINRRAHGLFHRAILQSANVSHQFVHRHQPFLGYTSAETAGAAFATAVVGPEPGQLERLRALPAADLAQAYSDQQNADIEWQGFWPSIDGDVIPENIFAAFDAGAETSCSCHSRS
jgi:para-nitrobenzyl esterase